MIASKSKSVRSPLSIIYSSMTALIVVIFIASLYTYVSHMFKKQASQTLQPVAFHISDKLDIELKNINDMAGRRMLSNPPHLNNWLTGGKTIVSRSKSFAGIFGAPVDSMIEIQQDYSVFQQLIEHSVSPPGKTNALNKTVYVFSRTGHPIYPSAHPESPAANAYWRPIQGSSDTSGTISWTADDDEPKGIVAYTRSAFSGWTAMLAESGANRLLPLTHFRHNMILIGLIAISLTLTLIGYVAKTLTAFRRTIHKFHLHTTAPPVGSTSLPKLKELEQLALSLNQMREQLQESLDELVVSRSRETELRMLALQAQMNPHFLYNALAIISIKAEDSGQEDIANMCNHLSMMLKYIAVDNSQPVTLEREVEYARQYLELMSIRFADQFEYHIDIPDELMNVTLPRLTIQPILENCFKHAFNQRPPWGIHVTGRLAGNRWTISICDNGTGFSAESLQRMEQRIRSRHHNQKHGEADSGIGLMNIYSRLLLLYGEQAVFQFANLPDGGARVSIGGLIMLKTGEEHDG